MLLGTTRRFQRTLRGAHTGGYTAESSSDACAGGAQAEQGGLSGEPVKEAALVTLRDMYRLTGAIRAHPPRPGCRSYTLPTLRSPVP